MCETSYETEYEQQCTTTYEEDCQTTYEQDCQTTYQADCQTINEQVVSFIVKLDVSKFLDINNLWTGLSKKLNVDCQTISKKVVNLFHNSNSYWWISK